MRAHSLAVAGLVVALALGAATTMWRGQARQAALWPAELPPRTATAAVWVDSLPTRLAHGGWSTEAQVGAWVPADDDADPRQRKGKRAAQRWGQQPASAAELARLSQVQRVRLYWPEGDMPTPGSHWQVKARWRAPDGAINPGGMDAEFQAWVRGVGAVGQVSPGAAQALPDAPWWDVRHTAWWDGWRATVRDRIALQVSDPTAAAVLSGLTVGDQSAIDGDEWEVFRRTGVAHLISISGSHIAVVGWWVAWLVRRHWGRSAWLAHRWPAPVAAQVLAVVVCTAYAALAGWGLPAQRTVWTMLGVVALRLMGRDWPWTLMGLWVMAWVSLLDPWALLQPGFWLSFLCVMVLMTMGLGPGTAQPDHAEPPPGSIAGRLSEALARWARGTQDFTRVQWTLTLAMAPLSLWCFQQVSVVGAMVNLGAVPLFDTVITPLALLGIAWPPLWSLDAWLIDWALSGLRDASSWSWAVWALPQAPLWLQVWGVVVGLMLAWPGPRGWRLGAALALVPLLCLPPSWRLLPVPGPGAFQALALDVGQGTAVLVRTQRHALLFDTGGLIGTADDAGHRHIVPALQALGVSRLDALVLSHEDADHVGGARSVLAGVDVVQVLGSLPEGHALRGADLQRAAQSAIPFGPCVAGLQWRWDGVSFEVLHPLPGPWEATPNAHACVLRVQAPGQSAHQAGASLLLTADIEADQEARLVAAEAQALARGEPSRLRSTVLMAPHHGSATSSTPDFLAAVAPRLVVVQAGRRNRYGHPSASVTGRYEAGGLPWLSTVGCGAWWWQSDEPTAQAAADATSPALGHCWQAQRQRWWTRPLAWTGEPFSEPPAP